MVGPGQVKKRLISQAQAAIVVMCLGTMLTSCDKPTPDAQIQATAGRNKTAIAYPHSDLGAGGLIDVTDSTGIDFQQTTQSDGRGLLPEVTAGGAAVLDYDGDGQLDIYLTNGSNRFSGGKQTSNRLYRQYAPGRFVDVTERVGIADTGYGMGVAVGDYDNDGDPDVFVANAGQNRLYRNDGSTFEDVTNEIGLASHGFSSSATFFDFDRDNDLDLYVVQYVVFDPTVVCYDDAGRRDFCGPLSFLAVSDELWRNDGEGGFVNISREAGLEAVSAAGLGVVTDDFNGDGWPDLYIANDAHPNHLWINNRDGRFREVASLSGVALNLHGQAEAGMGVVAEDFNGDGRTDLFMTHLYQETNTCYQRISDALAFMDVTSRVGLAGESMAYTGFGAAAIDLEHDGDLDLVVANGKVRNPSTITGEDVWRDFSEANQVFVNNGSGVFDNASEQFGEFCTTANDRIGVTRALAVGDIDGDGDIDVLINNIEGRARLYSSMASDHGNWLQVDVRILKCRRPAIGAVVSLTVGTRTMTRTIRRDGSYQSASQPIAHFGLGDSTHFDQLEIMWPNGQRQMVAPGEVNQKILVVQPPEVAMR